MKEQDIINYNRIAKAIDFIKENFKRQPSLEEMAKHIHISPYHFQRLFKEWAGVSPKKFLQYISVEYAKKIVTANKITISEVTFQTGLSSTGRLHDLFVTIEGMTPGEFKSGGEKLNINYSYAKCQFGTIMLAATAKGLCYMSFIDTEDLGFEALRRLFPKANFLQIQDTFQKEALSIFTSNWTKAHKIKLHLKGTDFQLKVWETLLSIPMGNLTTYGGIASKIKNPKAYQAVGTAIGNNPVAFLIPCHRVIKSSGNSDGYKWGNTRKKAIIGWEACQINNSARNGF